MTASGDVNELLTARSTKMSQPLSRDQSWIAVAHFCLGETLQLHLLEFVRVSQIKALISVPLQELVFPQRLNNQIKKQDQLLISL